MVIISNAFSLNMLSQGDATLSIIKVRKEVAREFLAEGFTSAIGHADTAAVVSDDLGINVPMNRITVTLEPGTTLVVAQYKGPRLPEGTTKLPEGAHIEYYVVNMK
jgi:hypothetical protein